MASLSSIFGGGSDRKARRRLAALARQRREAFSPSNPVGVRDINAGGLSLGIGEDGGFNLTGTEGLFGPEANEESLGLLRQLRAPEEARQLSQLESRLISQGRLGLGTGPSGANPELAGLFESFSQADLRDRLSSLDVGFRERQLQANNLFPALFNMSTIEEGRAQEASKLFGAGITAKKGPSAFGGFLAGAAPIAAGFFGGPAAGLLTNQLFKSNSSMTFGGQPDLGGQFAAGGFLGGSTFT